MSIDTRTAAEKRYDATRLSRTDYTPLSPGWEAVLDITDDPRDNGRQASTLPLETDTPISPDETRALDILLKLDDRIELAQQADQVMDADEAAIVDWITRMAAERHQDNPDRLIEVLEAIEQIFAVE